MSANSCRIIRRCLMNQSPTQSNPNSTPDPNKQPDIRAGAPLTDAEKKAQADKALADKAQSQPGYATKS